MADASQLSLHELDGERPDLVVISPNDPGAMRRYARECRELDIPYIYDPSQQIVRLDPDDLRQGVDGALSLFVNEYEFELLQKHTGMAEKDIRSKVNFMVVTCGESGARIYTHEQEYHVPAVPPQQISDPTGVGDAFRGGFLTGYRYGLAWEICGRMGALAATYCLENRGTLNHIYTPVEFINRYRSIFGEDEALSERLLVKK
jgi:adenosine kinase